MNNVDGKNMLRRVYVYMRERGKYLKYIIICDRVYIYRSRDVFTNNSIVYQIYIVYSYILFS